MSLDTVWAGSGASAVTGNFGPAGGVSATFRPAVQRGVGVSLSGTFGGATVSVEVSRDGGTSWRPMTIAASPWGVFTGAADEDVAEAQDATTRYRLVASGATGATTITYRLGH
ncbi:hypothetical protein [Sphingomonas sp. VNH70]|uniref:hypothetical protein n=1 Tax=Sphingomonas silueang TaxID=3156617 RepID=UPI0032B5E525